jgi:uncharacterized protein with FMN-binding domain
MTPPASEKFLRIAWLGMMLLTWEPAAAQTGLYKDGEFTGKPVDTEWGNVQVKVLIQGGSMVDVQFLQYPFHRSRSAELSGYTMPVLRSEAIKKQSADVYVYTGATMTAEGFQESLTSALGQAGR